MEVRALLRLKVDVLLDDECWGVEFPIQLGTLTGLLRTPAVTIVDDRRTVERWEWPPRLGTIPPGWSDEMEVVQLWNKRGFGKLHAFLLVLEAPIGDDLDAASEAAYIESDGWAERFRQWTGAISKQYTGATDRMTLGSEHPGQFLHLWVRNDDETRLPKRPPTTLAMGFDEYLGVQDLRRVVKETNAGLPPPAQRYFLAEARNHLQAGEFRPAVVDAATAAEIVLHGELERRLAPSGEELQQRVLKGATLGRQADLLRLRTAGFSIKEDLIQIRNKVLHRGETPTAVEASGAVSVAQALVDGLTPLP